MALLDPALVKAHCRVIGSADDTLLAAYSDAAVGLAEHYCNRTFAAPLPGAVQAALLLIVGDLYENRERQQDRPLTLNTTCESLLDTEKVWGHTSSGPAPAGVGFDVDGILIGDDWSRVWRWKDEAGAAIDVTGFTGTFELFDGETSVHSGALTISDPTGGEFAYALDEAATGSLRACEYWYRVRVVSPGGETTTIDRKRVQAQ